MSMWNLRMWPYLEVGSADAISKGPWDEIILDLGRDPNPMIGVLIKQDTDTEGTAMWRQRQRLE